MTKPFEIRVEWETAEGVADRVLARTWARIELLVDGRAVTRHEDLRIQALKEGVYGPAFPAAEWLVENWWALLHEHRRPIGLSGRMAGMRSWRRRHCLLFAREGNALPDLTLVPEGESMLFHLTPDPTSVARTPRYPLRFLEDMEVRLPLREVEAELSSFVNRVLAQLDAWDDEDTQRLRTNWKEIAASHRDEPDLCMAAARLGLDPYDPEELTPGTIETIETSLEPIPKRARGQILDAVVPANLSRSSQAVKEALSLVAGRAGSALDTSRVSALSRSKDSAAPAWEQGFSLAREFRASVGLGPAQPVDDLQAVLERSVSWAPDNFLVDLFLEDRNLSGVVACSNGGAPVLVGQSGASHSATRFRLARALGALFESTEHASPFVLSGAHTVEQARGRSFAAELLCPAEGLRSRVEWDSVDEEELRDLSEVFCVSQWVVAHQILNHKIAEVDSLVGW